MSKAFLAAARRLAQCAVPLACIALAGCGEGGAADDNRPSARVIDVIDGDTVEVERLGKVRLIGVDTPEKGRCGDDAATRFTRARLLGKTVQIEMGVDATDRYDRALAYLSRDEEMHNLALLSEGYARVLTIPPNDKYAHIFERAEREARPPAAGSLESCDQRRQRAALRRRRVEETAARAATMARERAREARREARAAARRLARRERAAARREEAERAYSAPEPEGDGGGGGGGGGSCLPSSACPGKRDGDGDGCYCE